MNRKLLFLLISLTVLFTTLPVKAEEKLQDELMKEAWRTGQHYVESEHYIKGINFLENYLKIRPRSVDGWFWLAKAYQGSGMIDKAQAAFTRAIEIDPEYPRLSRVLQNRETGEAIPLWDRSGKPYTKGLPVVDTAGQNGDYRKSGVIVQSLPDYEKNKKDSNQISLKSGQKPAYIPPTPEIENKKTQTKEKQLDTMEQKAYSPLAGKKVVILPPSAIKEECKVSKDYPGIPRINIPDEPVYTPPEPPETISNNSDPVYNPPIPEEIKGNQE